MHLLLIQLDSLPDGRTEELLSRLPEEKERLKKLRKEDFLRSAAAHAALRLACSRRLCVPVSALKFSRNAYGKPFLPDFEGIYFNLSHSGEYAACAVGEMPVGVDVEQIRPRRAVALAKKLFPEEELPKEDPLKAFFRLWTRRESAGKMRGAGLSDRERDGDCFLSYEFRTGDRMLCQTREHADYALSLCTPAPIVPEIAFCSASETVAAFLAE